MIDRIKCSAEVEEDKDRGGTLINGVENVVECNSKAVSVEWYQR